MRNSPSTYDDVRVRVEEIVVRRPSNLLNVHIHTTVVGPIVGAAYVQLVR